MTPVCFWVAISTYPLNPAQRCDAKRPCTTCIATKGVSECTYDSEKLPRSTGTYPVHRANGRSSGQDLGDAHTVDVPSSTSTHPPAKQNPTPSTSAVTGAMIHKSPAPRVLEADQGQRLALVRVHRNPSGQQVSPDSNPSISLISCFPLPGIPPEPYIPLSFLGGERLQVQTSEIAATDLDLRWCVPESELSVTISPSSASRLWHFFLQVKLGLKLTHEKLGAFLRGDQSGTVVHRFFVFIAQASALGFILKPTPPTVRLQGRRSKIAFEWLAELFKGGDYRLKVQAAACTASGYALLNLPQTSLLYIWKSCGFIQAGNIRFIPTCGRPPEFSEDLHETFVALSQTVYMATYLFLVGKGPEPRATVELEKEFRQELPVSGPTSAPFHIRLIYTTANLSDPLQDLSRDDANRSYLTRQRHTSTPLLPPCRR